MRIQPVPQRRFYAVKIAVGVGAGFGRTLAAVLQANFIFCGQRHAAQLQCRVVGMQHGGGIFRCRAGGAAGRQVKHRPAVVQRFQGREQHAHGFANAGGGLAKQLSALAAGLVHGPDHRPLAGAVAGKREAQRLQTGLAVTLPGRRPPRPGGVLGQQPLHDGLQRIGGIIVGKAKLELFIHLVVGQPHPHGGQTVLQRVDGRIALRLRPMLGALLAGDQLRRQGRGFDLVDGPHAVAVGKQAVGAALQGVGDALAAKFLPQSHFGFIVRVGLYGGALQFAVQACALIGAVKAGKAAVNAAAAQKKFHQPPDGQRQRQGFCLRHRGSPL